MWRLTRFLAFPVLAFLSLVPFLACGGGGDSGPAAPVTPAPTISQFTPTSGTSGTMVIVTGTSFTGASAMTFGGVAAPSFTVDADTKITTQVPALAVTGPIAVTTPGGTAFSTGVFTVLATTPAPTITQFAPTSAAVGILVTITGTHFTGGSGVTFGGVATLTFTVNSDTQITAEVPPLAVTGAIKVTTPGGTATSSGIFTVLAPTPMPTITQFSPTTATVGTKVTITGTHLSGASAVTFGGASAPSFLVDSDTQITVEVPTLAITGPLAVSTPGGIAVSAGIFTVVVLGQGPSITGFNPTHGPVGTKVILTGTNFTAAATVAFNGTNAPSITYVGPLELDVLVPGGATTGAISVMTADGTATSSGAFTVDSAVTTLDLFLDGSHITQSTQAYTGTVPLVADRDGYLRLFARCNELNTARPSLRASIYNGAALVWQATVPAPGSSTPTTIVEGDITKSWNVLVPGANLQPGYSLKVEIDPAGGITEVDKSNNTILRTLDIRAVKVFRTTLIPVVQAGLTGNVDSGRTLVSWTDRLQRMYPIQNMPDGVDVVKSAPYATTQNLNTGGLDAWVNLLDELEAKRLAETSSRYYFGAVNVTSGLGINGLSYMEGTAAIGWDKAGLEEGNNYPEVYAHEVGHLFGRQHAPCNVMDPDPNWPADPAYAKALIGVYGFDLATSQLMDRAVYKDLLSYCSPIWISDYTYKGILAYRASSSFGFAEESGAALSKRECLLVSGRVSEGRMILDPALKVFTVPCLPKPGAFRLELHDRGGRTLETVSFVMKEVADLPGVRVKHFVFTLPLEASTEAALYGLRIMENAEMRASRTAGPVGSERTPAAVRFQPGVAQLSWDAVLGQKIMVRDSRTDEVLAFAEGGRLEFPTDAPELECTVSDGVRSRRYRIGIR